MDMGQIKVIQYHWTQKKLRTWRNVKNLGKKMAKVFDRFKNSDLPYLFEQLHTKEPEGVRILGLEGY